MLKTNQSALKLQSGLEGIAGRDFDKLSHYKDLTRLCREFTITSPEGKLLFKPSQDSNTHILAREVLGAMAKLLEPLHYELIEQDLERILGYDGDVGQQLKDLFLERNSFYIPDSRIGIILRVVHQEIIYPVVVQLRDAIYSEFPFKDVRGSWIVKITLQEDGGITVSHCKKEQAHDPDKHFIFGWQMNVHFNADLSKFTSDFFVTDATISPEAEGLSRLLQPFHHRSKIYNSIWQKPSQEILESVSISLPRIADAVSIYRNQTEVFSQFQMDNICGNSIFQFLVSLAHQVDPPPVEEHIRRTFFLYVSRTGLNGGEISAEILTALRNGAVPLSSRTFRILKAIHHDVPYPAVMKLREQIYPYAQYRDAKGSWKVRIVLHEYKYQMIIQKKETSNSVQENGYFDFTWQLTLTFDSHMSEMYDAVCYITKYSAHQNTKPELRKWLEKLFVPFECTVSPPVFKLKKSASATSILTSAIATLRHMTEVPMISLPEFSEPVSLLKALEALSEGSYRGTAFPTAFLTISSDIAPLPPSSPSVNAHKM